MKNNSVKKNYIFNLSYQIFSMIAPLVTTPYVSRVLKAGGVGLYSYTYTIATIFVAIAQMGTVTYAVREIAYCQNDKEKVSSIFWNVFSLRLLTTALASIVYICLFCKGEYKDVFIVQLLCIVGVTFDISWLFQGIEKFQTIAIRDFLSKIVSIVLVFLLVKEEDDVELYTAILALAIIAGRLANWVILPRYIEKVSFRKVRPFKNLRDIFILFIPQISSQLYIAVDKTMIELFSHETIENGYYAQADRIIKLCVAVLTSIVNVMLPRIAETYVSRKNDMNIYIYKTYRFIWMLGCPLALGISATISTIIPWFMGEGYDKVVVLIYIFAVQIVLLGVGSTNGMILVNIQLQKYYSVSVICGVVINVVLNLLLIPLLLSIGAAIASVIAEFVIVFIQFCFLRKKIKVLEILKLIKNYLFASLVMFFVIIRLKESVSYTMLGTVELIITGMLSYVVTLIVIKDEFLLKYMGIVTKTFVKSKK